MFERLRRARHYLEAAEQRRLAVPVRPDRSLARDVVVSLLDPEKRKLGLDVDAVVGGALLAELVVEGRLEVTGTGKSTRVTVRDPTPLGDDELDDALATVGSGLVGTKVTWLLELLPTADELLRRLVRDGALVDETRTVLKVVTLRRHRPTPAAGRDELVARVRSALRGDSVPDGRTALILGLVDAGRMLRTFVSGREIDLAHRNVLAALERLGDTERAVVAAVEVKVDRANRSG